MDGESGDATPLVLGMRYGAGQSLYVATDEIWRWRYGRGELLPEQFWIQLLRLLGREAVQGDQPVRILAEPQQAELGRPVRLTVDLLDASGGIAPPESVMVEAIDADGGVVGSAELPASGEASWAGTWIPPGLGEIRFRITEPGLSALAGAIDGDDRSRPTRTTNFGIRTRITTSSRPLRRRPVAWFTISKDDQGPVLDRIHDTHPAKGDRHRTADSGTHLDLAVLLHHASFTGDHGVGRPPTHPTGLNRWIDDADHRGSPSRGSFHPRSPDFESKRKIPTLIRMDPIERCP